MMSSGKWEVPDNMIDKTIKKIETHEPLLVFEQIIEQRQGETLKEKLDLYRKKEEDFFKVKRPLDQWQKISNILDQYEEETKRFV